VQLTGRPTLDDPAGVPIRAWARSATNAIPKVEQRSASPNPRMALQSLIENLQREGLDDAERGDGVVGYITTMAAITVDDIRRLLKAGKTPEDLIPIRIRFENAKDAVGQLLGLSKSRIDALIQIATWKEELKEPIRAWARSATRIY
jgi:hypothetical protein